MKSLKSLSQASLASLLFSSLLVACGGSDSSGTADQTGSFSLSVTDAPVDNAVSVVVTFTGVSIKPADGEAIEFTFAEERSIDLLQLQGSVSDSLIAGETVPAGAYEWIRLHVNAEEDNIFDSYLELNDGTQQELWIPSGSETGLKLVSGFTVPAGGSADFTIDFDLRKSVTDPQGMSSAILRPSLRLVDNVVVGSIEGIVSVDLINASCADPAMDDGSVYVYSGADVTPVDIQGTESDPIASALVHLNEETYEYEVGFLPEGEYTVAYTCEAGADDITTMDSITFSQAVNVTVVAGVPSAADLGGTSEQEVVQ